MPRDTSGVLVKGVQAHEANEWLKVMAEIPVDENGEHPLRDDDGDLAELGNVGDTIFLAGTEGGTATRTFDIEAGDKIVLPMINLFGIWPDDLEEIGIDTTKELSELHSQIFDLYNVESAFLKVDLDNDGSIDIERVFDVAGATYYPRVDFSDAEDKQARQFFVKPDIMPFDIEDYPGTEDGIDPTVEEGLAWGWTTGYYAQIRDLPEGTHMITYGGSAIGTPEIGIDPFATEVIATITVVPEEPLIG